jgi:hypothetical protein
MPTNSWGSYCDWRHLPLKAASGLPASHEQLPTVVLGSEIGKRLASAVYGALAPHFARKPLVFIATMTSHVVSITAVNDSCIATPPQGHTDH